MMVPPWLVMLAALCLLFCPWCSSASSIAVVEGEGLDVVYNFATYVPSWEMTQSEEEVVTGVWLVRGKFNSGAEAFYVRLAMQNVIKSLCTAGSETIITESKVEGSSSVEWNYVTMEFKILPPLGGGGDCAYSVINSAAGGDAPPFGDDIKAPDVREALIWDLLRSDLTNYLDVSDWYSRIDVVFCIYNQVKKSENHIVAVGQTWDCSDFLMDTSPNTRAPGTSTTETTTKRTHWAVSSDDPCDYTQSACMCSQRAPKCMWKAHSSGGFRCTEVSNAPDETELCAVCPTRQGCSPTEEVKCEAALSMCGCALVGAFCNWTLETGTCSRPASGPTGVPCDICSMVSDSCERPAIIDFKPQSGAFFSREVVYEINLTFDSPVRFSQPGEGQYNMGTASFICEKAAGAFLPANAPQNPNIVMTVPQEQQQIYDSVMLRLLADSLKFHSNYECTVDFPDALVVGMEGSPSLSWTGAYSINVRDNVDPVSAYFEPSNSDNDVPLDLPSVNVTFVEPVYVWVSDAKLYRLASDEEGDYVFVGMLSMVSADSLTVSLVLPEGLLEDDQLYSVAIPEGHIVDSEGNQFRELSNFGAYTFRTVMAVRTIQEESQIWSKETWIAVICGCAAFVCIVTTGAIGYWRWSLEKKYDVAVRSAPSAGDTPKKEKVMKLPETLPPTDNYWEVGRSPVIDRKVMPTVEMDIPGAVREEPRSNSRTPSKQSGGSGRSSRAPSDRSRRSSSPAPQIKAQAIADDPEVDDLMEMPPAPVNGNSLAVPSSRTSSKGSHRSTGSSRKERRAHSPGPSRAHAQSAEAKAMKLSKLGVGAATLEKPRTDGLRPAESSKYSPRPSSRVT